MCVYDLIPVEKNPRNSEGSFLETDDGILFAYSGFHGDSYMDHAYADIMLIRSRDGGRTWSAPETAARAADAGAMNLMSVSLLRMQDGGIGLFYLTRMTWADMVPVLRRSGDGGRSWSEPVCCTPRRSYYVINNDRATRLASGRIILPLAEHPNKTDEKGNLQYFAPAQAVFVYSDDDGLTWHEAEDMLKLEVSHCYSGLQEPGFAETAPDRLYGWARTDLGRQYEFFSHDGGVHWTQAQPSWFTSPLSPLSMKKLRDGRLIAFWNPVPHCNVTDLNRATGNRTPLVYALSADGGQSWSAPVTLENDPDRGYCYTAICETEDALLLAYCAGSAEDMGGCLNRLRIRRMPLPEKTEP